MQTVESFADHFGIEFTIQIPDDVRRAYCRFNPRLRVRFGVAKTIGSEPLGIEINCSLRHHPGDLRRTFLHEVAHLMTPGAGHGRAWKRMARALGGSDERCRTHEDAERVLGPAFRQRRHAYRCERCGIAFTRARRITSPMLHLGCGGKIVQA
jgi:predicted SprT family Zn-dependent metalloprotease